MDEKQKLSALKIKHDEVTEMLKEAVIGKNNTLQKSLEIWYVVIIIHSGKRLRNNLEKSYTAYVLY